MYDLDGSRIKIAEWLDTAIRTAREAGKDSTRTSLDVMDDFERTLDSLPTYRCTRDLWVSADFQEWCIGFAVAGREIFVNNDTLAHFAPSASGN